MRPQITPVKTLGLGVTVVLLLGLLSSSAWAQSSAFSYQGQLKDGDVSVDAIEARIVFRLFNAASGGSQLGSDWVAYPVEITEGLFTTLVDFGSGPLSVGDSWLEIGVDTSGGTNYTWMAPRQPLTPAPTAVFALSGGDNPWNIDGNDLWYSAGNIGLGTDAPDCKLYVKGDSEDPLLKVINLDENSPSAGGIYSEISNEGYALRGYAVSDGAAYGVMGESRSSNAAGVFGYNGSPGGTPKGVHGEVASADGMGVYGYNTRTSGDAIGVMGRTGSETGYGGWFDGRGYFSNWVGIRTAPSCELDVAGSIKAEGFQLSSTPTDGYVLTSDANGVASWQPAPTTGGYWLGSGSNIYFNAGNVGIGTANPMYPLYVYTNDDGVALKGRNDMDGGIGVDGTSLSGSGTGIGVYGIGYSPDGKGVRGSNIATTGGGVGVYGTSASPDGACIMGESSVSTGSPKAVYGKTNSATGYGGYFEGRGYFSSDVGIGVTEPTSALDVDGTVTMTGLMLSTSPQDGHVLTSDASGNATWQAPPEGGSSLWDEGAGGIIYYNGGNVGIGTANPNSPFYVYEATGTTAITGRIDGASGQAVTGNAYSTSGTGAGVLGASYSPTGMGVHGLNGSTTGTGYGVYGETYSPDGFGGYFDGRGYFSGEVGIGTDDPGAELEVVGTAKMTGLQLPTSAQSGHVLTSDASGNATWQAPPTGGSSQWQDGAGGDIYFSTGDVGINTSSPAYDFHVNGSLFGNDVYAGDLIAYGFKLDDNAQAGHVLTSDAAGNATWQAPAGGSGFSLPYSGSTASTSAAFEVTNTGTGSGSHAIRGEVTGSDSSSAAGYFYALNGSGNAIRAYSDVNDAIYAKYNGTAGYAIWASTVNGKGAGYFDAGTSQNGRAGRFVADGFNASVIHASSSGGTATGLRIETTGAESYGGYITSPHIGLVAKGGITGAKIYGDLELYEYGTSNKVVELGKGLDYAEGFDVTGGKDAACAGCVLVIDPSAAGNLTVCTEAYDTKVAGIVAGANGLGSGVRLGSGEFDHDVALAGRVYCNVIALAEDIQPGDMLTTSNIAGYAMEVKDRSRAQGAILGKAMEPMAKGQKGQILVLVTLQ